MTQHEHEHEHCFHGSLWERNNLPSNSSFDSKVLYSNTWYGCWIFLENRIEKSRQALSDSKLQLFRSNVWLVLLNKDKKWIISHFVASQIKNWYLLSLSEIPSSFHLGFHDSVTIHHRPNFISMLGYQNQPNIYRKWRRNAEPIFLPLIWEGLMKDSILANVSCLVCGIRFVHMFRIKNIAFIMLTCSLMTSGGNIEGNLCVIEHTNAYKQSCMKLCAILLSALSTSTIRNRTPLLVSALWCSNPATRPPYVRQLMTCQWWVCVCSRWFCISQMENIAHPPSARRPCTQTHIYPINMFECERASSPYLSQVFARAREFNTRTHTTCAIAMTARTSDEGLWRAVRPVFGGKGGFSHWMTFKANPIITTTTTQMHTHTHTRIHRRMVDDCRQLKIKLAARMSCARARSDSKRLAGRPFWQRLRTGKLYTYAPYCTCVSTVRVCVAAAVHFICYWRMRSGERPLHMQIGAFHFHVEHSHFANYLHKCVRVCVRVFLLVCCCSMDAGSKRKIVATQINARTNAGVRAQVRTFINNIALNWMHRPSVCRFCESTRCEGQWCCELCCTKWLGTRARDLR